MQVGRLITLYALGGLLALTTQPQINKKEPKTKDTNKEMSFSNALPVLQRCTLKFRSLISPLEYQVYLIRVAQSHKLMTFAVCARRTDNIRSQGCTY